MKIVQISDTHGLHHQLTNLPSGDVLIHCGDFCHHGTEEETLDFLNWFIDLPYAHKIFVTGNHDVCLWDADGIEDLPYNVHFLQDKGITIDGISFWGLGYNHDETQIPKGTDIVITHEPPLGILDRSNNINWGNSAIRKRIEEVAPRYHLFGHAHEASGVIKRNGTIYSNAALTDNIGNLKCHPTIFSL